MAVTLYCKDEPFLKIGNPIKAESEDGILTTLSEAEVVFHNGYATVEEWTPRIEQIVSHTQRTYNIINLGSDPDTVDPSSDGAVECPECGVFVKSSFALAGHLRTHKPKKAAK